MKIRTVRGVEIGRGIPKICVPVIGETQEEILREAAQVVKAGADLVEWRCDWFRDVLDWEKTEELLGQLRLALGECPLLVTFRTEKEGGARAISTELYVELNRRIVESHQADLIDVELFTGESEAGELVELAHENGVLVVMSNHDFQKTPRREEILERLCKMQELGADLPKIAVMPQSPGDVLVLLSATEEMHTNYADRPIITMSMAGMGAVSRLSGEVFGSAVTFGSHQRSSAPGQLDVQVLRQGLEALHRGMDL